MAKKLVVSIVTAAGVFVSRLVLAEAAPTQASIPAEPRPSASAGANPGGPQQATTKSGRTLLKIGTRYSIERSEFNKSLSASRWGFIDDQGRVAIEPQYEEVSDSAEGITAVKQNGKWGWIDQTGSHIDAQLLAPVKFHEGLASFKRDGKEGFLDSAGKVVIEPQWEAAGDFNEGLASVTQNGQQGFIDKTGKIVIKPGWELAGAFHDGLAGVKEKGKWGYIDKAGRMVIKPEWDDSGEFIDGFAIVFRNNKAGVINKQGKVVVPLEWEMLLPCEMLLEPELQYDVAPENDSEPAGATQERKLGCIQKNGEVGRYPTAEEREAFL